MPSQEKAKSELEEHENSCDCKNNEAKQLENKKNNWDNCKKTTERYFYTCDKGCWSKVCLDKNIADWQKAKKQALADLAYHQNHECGSEERKKIAICFSPNQGSNEHDLLSYADKIDESKLRLEKDNQEQITKTRKYCSKQRRK